MANPYTQPTLSGYNSNPPEDDGSNVASNEITWDRHKTKLGDPLKSFAQSIDSNVSSAFAARLLNSVSSISSDYTVQASDRGVMLSCSNTITITLLAAGTAGSGFELVIRNDGSGTVTVDGDGSETINGSATVDLAPSGWLILVSDGSNWLAVDKIKPLVSIQTFTSSGTWNRPTGCQYVVVEVTAAGGGGGGAKATSAGEASVGSGGASGSHTRSVIDVSGIPSSTITVGSGGTGSSGASGGDGGNSSWSDGTNTVSAVGGGGGDDSTAGSGTVTPLGSTAGAGGSGDLTIDGRAGGLAWGVAGDPFARSGDGADSYHGGGARGSVVATSFSQAGSNASVYGSGGSGALNLGNQSAAAGGDGADGLVVVTEYY